MTTLEDWIELCWQMGATPKHATAGSRKILRGIQRRMPMIDDSVQLQHSGYEPKGVKLKQLVHFYRNEDSLSRAVEDWKERLASKRYGSVGVTTHGAMKGGFTKQGHCIQSMTVTLIQSTRGKPMHAEVDVFYRTTEVVKKFGADLVFLRDHMISEFDFTGCSVESVNFHFANLSAHPMFYAILAIVDKNWIDNVRKLEKTDPQFHRSVMRWSWRNFHGADSEKFATAARVTKGLKENMDTKWFNRVKRFVAKEQPE